MLRLRKGFTLIELLVVIVIIGILVAIALPNFIKIKEKAREAETKQNLHSVQIALERYATDSDGASYPMWIAGGDWTDSYTINETYRNRNITQEDIDALPPGKQGIEIAADGFGDSLIMDGYLTEAPRNAFIVTNTKGGATRRIAHRNDVSFGNGNMVRNQIGGMNNNLMTELLGPPIAQRVRYNGDLYVQKVYEFDANQLTKPITTGGQNKIGNAAMVGNFLYYATLANPRYKWIYYNFTSEPAGYFLCGFGSFKNAGMDVYDVNANFPGRFRTNNCGENYLGIPCPPAGGQNTTTASFGGPDGVKDGVIVVLESGSDVKGQNTDESG